MNGSMTRQRPGTGSAPTGVAARAVRTWVTCYTGWVGAEAAERRRDEIHSDLWEQQSDARATGAPPILASLSIARRAAFGVPSDLLWVHTQRTVTRSLPTDKKAFSMNSATRFAARWWWALGASILAAFALTMSTGQLLAPGMPYLHGTIQGYVMALLLVAGILLRVRAPRASGILVAAGASTFAALYWAPVVMAIGLAVLLGAAAEVVRLTARGRRGLAIAGLVAVVVTPLGYSAVGFGAGSVGLMWFVAAGVGVALLTATGNLDIRRPVTTA